MSGTLPEKTVEAAARGLCNFDGYDWKAIPEVPPHGDDERYYQVDYRQKAAAVLRAVTDPALGPDRLVVAGEAGAGLPRRELAGRVAAAEREVERLRKLLRGLVEVEDQPCRFDHHGYCQEHGWFGEPGECYTRDARIAVGLDAASPSSDTESES